MVCLFIFVCYYTYWLLVFNFRTKKPKTFFQFLSILLNYIHIFYAGIFLHFLFTHYLFTHYLSSFLLNHLKFHFYWQYLTQPFTLSNLFTPFTSFQFFFSYLIIKCLGLISRNRFKYNFKFISLISTSSLFGLYFI